MNHQMHIGLDGERLTIQCPFWANDLIRNIPSRRWNKSKRHWVVPMLRKNMEELLKIKTMPGVAVSEDAAQAINKYIKASQSKKTRAMGLPSWYKPMMPPRKHQQAYFGKRYGLNAFALHADRGTGKTYCLINVACAMRMEGKIDAMLVIVKLSGRGTWKENLIGPIMYGDTVYENGIATVPVDLHLPDTNKQREFDKWLRRPHDFKVMVCGIESMSQGRMKDMARRFLNATGKVYMVIDESHLIGTHNSIRTQEIISLGKLATYRESSTGSPISTGPLNLFSQFEFLDPDIIGIGDFYAYRNHYAVVLEQKTKAGKKFPMIVGYKNIDELTKTVAPYTFEVRKADVLPDLPPKTYQKSTVQLTAEQRKLYDQIKKTGEYEAGGKTMTPKNVLELALRLHQVAGGFVTSYREEPYIGRGGEGKMRRISVPHAIMPWQQNPKIIDLLDICNDDKQFIIWAAYRSEIQIIVEALEETFPREKIVQIHGGIVEEERARFRHLYQAGRAKFMVGNTATGGSADTWTACETMVYYNNTERMVDREQSEDRAHRDGLKHPVLYIDIIAEGTVDVGMMKSVELKIDLSEYIRRNIREASAILSGAIE